TYLRGPPGTIVARLSSMSASLMPSGVGARIGSSTCLAWALASSHELGMYSSLMPSMWAQTCHECRNAADSFAGIGTFHLTRFCMTVVGRLCHVTIMSAWLMGFSSSATFVQCGDFGSRWRTPACASRVLTQVTIISPL